MSHERDEREELAQVICTIDGPATIGGRELAQGILDAGYRKPRTITTPAELDRLAFGSAVQTSDDSDTVVLKGERGMFRNQSGGEVPASVLWKYGTHPFTVLYAPGES